MVIETVSDFFRTLFRFDGPLKNAADSSVQAHVAARRWQSTANDELTSALRQLQVKLDEHDNDEGRPN